MRYQGEAREERQENLGCGGARDIHWSEMCATMRLMGNVERWHPKWERWNADKRKQIMEGQIYTFEVREKGTWMWKEVWQIARKYCNMIKLGRHEDLEDMKKTCWVAPPSVCV